MIIAIHPATAIATNRIIRINQPSNRLTGLEAMRLCDGMEFSAFIETISDQSPL
ncbi:MAG: hypothetical protein KA144_04410 [Xanthomonadaceae bacterium]|nr:hypothetical protein [Xanthomonadaceae bacterium]